MDGEARQSQAAHVAQATQTVTDVCAIDGHRQDGGDERSNGDRPYHGADEMHP